MRVLVVSCHPDDAELSCGGTVLRYTQRGDHVTICHVANGNMGHVLIMPDELREIRAEEARNAGRMLGATRVISLDVDDLYLNANDMGVVRALTEVIREANPDVILTHDPNDYMKDHVEVSRLAFDASFSATVPHFASGPHINRFIPIFYMDTLAGVNFQPEQYVDITDTLEQKLNALECHESQIKWMRDHDHIDFPDMLRTCARYRGYQCGVRYAEGFKQCMVYPRVTAARLLP